MSESLKRKLGYVLIILITLFALFWFVSNESISQDLNYHNFYDSRVVFNIPNFYNVISNVFFLLIGIAGLYITLCTEKILLIKEIKVVYIMLFFGTVMIAIGSGYYHLRPDNMTLVWDRLPMSIVFMALFSIIIGEFVSTLTGKWLFIPLLFAGIISVIYWYLTESQGIGDLRLYALVQFYPLFLIPVFLLFFRSRYTHVHAYWILFIIYGVSKIFEYYDGIVFEYSGFISGHTIKHILSAVALGVLLVSYEKRQLNID
jgi:hypothetical protein